MAMTTAIAIGLALLVLAILAVTVGMRGSGSDAGSDKAAVRANGGPITVFVGALAYLVIFAPRITDSGLTLETTLLLVVAVAIPPIVSALTVGIRDRLGEQALAVLDLAGVILAFTLLVGLLATAGSVLSLMGGVNRWLATAAIGCAVAGYLLLRGRQAASRTSRWTLGIALVIPVVLLAVGAAKGTPSTIITSLVPSTPLPVGSVGALLAAALVAGFVDPTLGLVLRGSDKPVKTSIWGAVIIGGFVLIFGVALILIFGGAFVAPSLQAFLLAAAPATVIAGFLFFAVFVLASASDSQLAAGSQVAADMYGSNQRRAFTVGLAVVAVVVAMFVPAPGQVFVIGAVVAAAAVGAVLPATTGTPPNLDALPGLVVGVVAALLAGVVMGLSSTLSFSGTTFIALFVAIAFASLTSSVVANRALTATPTVVAADADA